ncbi:MAG: hypothetical protein KBA26_14735 [Candidatus Delongbacteria bacterium]|nr:hypothetical protein [Candidatus Delongbacteria bacterium]
MIQPDDLRFLIKIYHDQQTIYRSILQTAIEFNDRLCENPGADCVLDYFQHRLSREKEISGLDQAISREKKLWQDHKDRLPDSDPLKQELKELLDDIRLILAETLRIDTGITDQVRTRGVQIRSTQAVNGSISQANALNRYKQQKK